MAEACLLADQLDEAGEAADAGLAAARRTGERGAEARGLYIASECAARTEPREACESFALALALAEQLKTRPLVAHCHLGLGKLYHRTDKREQAQEHLATATTVPRDGHEVLA